MKFSCCKSTLDGGAGTLTCSKCKRHYHHQCIDPTTSKNDPGLSAGTAWVCPKCSLDMPRQVNTDNTPVRGLRTTTYQSESSGNINLRRGASCAQSPGDNEFEGSLSPDTVRQIFAEEFSKIKHELTSTFMDRLSSDLKGLREEFCSLKESVAFINTKYDEISTKLNKLESNIKQLSSVNLEVQSARSEVEKLKAACDIRDQWDRRSNIEIFGIPEKKGENLITLLRDITEKASFHLDPSKDIDFVTRVSSKNKDKDMTKPIIARFISRYRKDDCLAQLRKLKITATDLGFTSGKIPIHFNDHLTSNNKALLKRAKSIAKEKHYKYVWVRNCTIMARHTDTSHVIHINSEKDLNKL